jgi:hypothetical protein
MACQVYHNQSKDEHAGTCLLVQGHRLYCLKAFLAAGPVHTAVRQLIAAALWREERREREQRRGKIVKKFAVDG